MPEDDQTKWVGIRPVNPPENIPTYIQGAAVPLGVYPFPAATEFNTLTKKRAPAGADISAIEFPVSFYDQRAGNGAMQWIDAPDVPAGKFWVVTYIMSMHYDTENRTIQHFIREDAVYKVWLNRAPLHPPQTPLISTGNMIVDSGEKISFYFYQVPATAQIYSSFCGYQISKY